MNSPPPPNGGPPWLTWLVDRLDRIAEAVTEVRSDVRDHLEDHRLIEAKKQARKQQLWTLVKTVLPFLAPVALALIIGGTNLGNTWG